ncbi:serine protease [Mesorhizobium sp.]|uniref:serine protease n=1 Tax=Mesorhizobium sp. TaxID=1871066 RepID=UPI0025E0FD3C|nr:serine protease [Mesorhizobium sp.]
MLSTRDLLNSATVEILDSAGKRRLGTGTIITNNGTVLTCHHVIAGMSRVRLVRHGADQRTADVSIDLSNASEEFDLAILESGWAGLVPVPILQASSAAGNWIANGFQDLQLGYQGLVPLAGTYRAAKVRKYAAVSSSETGTGSRRDYVLTETLDLDGSAVHGGTSGASAVDEETSAIVGTIVGSLTNPDDPVPTHTRSIAISVPHAASIWPPLMDICASASREVPCFGKALNALGAEILCTAQRMETLQDLTVAKLIDGPKLRLRAGLDTALREFLADDAPLMPVIGESGAGKTSIAAMLSCGMGLRHCLLLRGVHMQAGDTNIAVQIERALTDDEYGTYGLDRLVRPDLSRPGAETLARIASTTGERLVVVLDAINERDEALLPAQRIAGSWMPRTIDWLRRNNAKLIVTCRPETWSTLLPRPLLDAVFPPPHERSPSEDELRPGISRPPGGGLWVGDLSEQELEEMIRVYGVDRRIDPVDARHPFFLRLAAELGPHFAKSSDPMSRLQLIDAALDHRVNDIVMRYPLDAVGTSEVRALIASIAAAMLSEATDILAATKALRLPLATPNVLRGLIDFGVIERVGVNYRFRFDQYADAERSRLLTLPLPTNFDGIAPDFGDKRLRSTVGMTAERMYSASPSKILLYESIVRDSAPLALRVGLLIETARIDENGYGLRVKDWADEQYYGDRFYDWIDERWFGRALKDLHAEDSATVLKLLSQRLDDERPITGGDNREASVASLCGGCLCAIGGDDVRNYVSELLSDRSYVATSVLDVALRRRPQPLATALLQHSSKLAAHGDASTNEIKVLLAGLLCKACQLMSTEEFRASVLEVLRGWTDDAETVSVRSISLAAIRKIDPADVAALDRIVFLLGVQSSDEEFRTALSQLEYVPEDCRGKVVEQVLARIDSLAGQWNIWGYGVAWTIFGFLERPDIRQASALMIIDTLRQHAAKVAEDDTAIARWAFLVVRDIEPNHPAWPGLFDLLERVIENATSRTEITFVDYAYCDLPIEGEAAQQTRRILGTRKLRRDSLRWAVFHSVKNASKFDADDCVRMLASLRASDHLSWDQFVHSYVTSERQPGEERPQSQFVEAVLRYWRSLPESELTQVSQKAIGLDS